jgi:hypothetical protein
MNVTAMSHVPVAYLQFSGYIENIVWDLRIYHADCRMISEMNYIAVLLLALRSLLRILVLPGSILNPEASNHNMKFLVVFLSFSK